MVPNTIDPHDPGPTVRREPDAFDQLIDVLRNDFRRLFPHLKPIEAQCFRVEREGDSLSGKVWTEFEVRHGLRRVRQRTTLFINGGRVVHKEHHEEPVLAGTPSPTTRGMPERLNLSVLVADDWPDAADSLARILRLCVRSVHTAYDGEAAVALAEQVRPDVAVLDVQMPRADGLHVARELARRPSGKPFLIAMSGFLEERDRAIAYAAGFDYFLRKPVDAEGLVVLLEGHAARLAARAGETAAAGS